MELGKHKVLIHGLGRHGGGVAAARYCAEQGAAVTVTDLADEAALADSLAQLRDVPIARFELGRHRQQDFRGADVVVVNPAVRPGNELVQLARTSGAAITSETELFLHACGASVIGVTGTVGKSTTAAMLAEILKAGGRRAWLGGNIGHSLLAELPRIEPGDLVVLEMSSFQLYWLSETARWPRAAVVTNCRPNHLDWHRTWERYVAAKQRLLTHLPDDGFCVLNTVCPEVNRWRGVERERRVLLDLEFLRTGWDGRAGVQLQLLGLHNRANAACAATAARQLGIDHHTAARTMWEFKGLPHRLQRIGEKLGRAFIDDSKSTSPAATMAALWPIPAGDWLLLGGADAGADFSEMAGQVTAHVKGAAVFGTAGSKLLSLFGKIKPGFPCFQARILAEAFDWCVRQSCPGETILLSPGCPSTDQFRDYAHRGEEFQRLVREFG